jgi:TPR repeat protein
LKSICFYLTKAKILTTSVLASVVFGICGCGGDDKQNKPAIHQEVALLGITPAEHEKNSSNPNSKTQIPPIAQDASEEELEELFNKGEEIYGFFPTSQTLETLQKKCASWAEPTAPDEISQHWYRAATTIDAIKLITAKQYQQMMILYEAAARKGHYKATMNLTVHYSTGRPVKEGRYSPEPLKARMWINEGIRHGWTGALEWLATAYKYGFAGYRGYKYDDVKYLARASEFGVAIAQYDYGLYHEHEFRQLEKRDALMECAGKQGTFPTATYHLAMIKEVDDFSKEALEYYQLAVMGGNEGGIRATVPLYSAFSEDSSSQDLKTEYDPIRYQAYHELNIALDGGYDSQKKRHEGNKFLKFPKLNEVLPLPPAKITEWKGIYSAMSDDDAKYYQNPPSAEYYIEEVKKAGYMVPDEYLNLSKLVPREYE